MEVGGGFNAKKRGTVFWSLPFGWVQMCPRGAGDNAGAGEVHDGTLDLWPSFKPSSLERDGAIVPRVVEPAFF